MTDRVTIRLSSVAARERAKRYIDRAPDNYSARIGEETRSDAQNRMLWPMIKDIREQAPGHDQYTPDQTKLRFLNALGHEMMFLPELDGGGMFPVGQRSSLLTKDQFGMLLTLIFAHGDEKGVFWSHPSQQIRDEAEHGVDT